MPPPAPRDAPIGARVVLARTAPPPAPWDAPSAAPAHQELPQQQQQQEQPTSMWSNNAESSQDKEHRGSTAVQLSPTTPTSEDEPQPMPEPPRSLSPVPEGQDAAEEREDTSWHGHYLEERARAVEAQDPWENWVWSARMGRWDWVDPAGTVGRATASRTAREEKEYAVG